ncbi:MAG: N-acetylmuramoyl-L-alanine amidase [Chloroflexota bacterium]
MGNSAALSRRQLLRLCLGIPVAATLLSGAAAAVQAAPKTIGAGAVKAGRRELAVADLVSGYDGGAEVDGDTVRVASGHTVLLLTRPSEASLPFQAVGAHYVRTGAGELSLWLRTSSDGEKWTDWHLCGTENVVPTADGRTHSTLFFTPGNELHRYAQCRLSLKGQDAGAGLGLGISSFGLDFLDASDGPSDDDEPQPSVITTADKPGIISRTAWGCSDGQASPGWTPEYYTAGHIIVHHTATPNGESNWYARVRSIWYYHAVTLGWGDVGYNFMVDPNGVIYEGRAGANASGHNDDDVEAGHCYSYNRYSVGLAIIGDYSSTAPTGASLNAAERLMSWKLAQRGLGAKDSGLIRRGCDGAMVNMPRIAGHTDYGVAGWGAGVCPGSPSPQTSCPGAMLYAKLPEMRDAAASMTPNEQFSISNVSIGPRLVAVGGRLTVTATITNTGNTTIYSGSPTTGHVYDEGAAAAGSGFGTFRLGLDYDGRDPNQGSYPYRWGIGGDLPAGASSTIQVSITVRYESIRNYWVGLIKEGVGLLADRLAITSIQGRVKHGEGVCIANVTVRPPVVFPGNVLEVYAEIENWTNSTVPTQGPGPGYTYAEGEICSADVGGAYRIGLDYAGRPAPVDHPYRWGLGSSLPPLSVRAIRGFVRLNALRSPTNYWVGLVKEQYAWIQDNLAVTSVRVQNPSVRLRMPLVNG